MNWGREFLSYKSSMICSKVILKFYSRNRNMVLSFSWKKNARALVYSFVRSISKDLENTLCLFFRPDLKLDLSFTNRGLLMVFLLKKWDKELLLPEKTKRKHKIWNGKTQRGLGTKVLFQRILQQPRTNAHVSPLHSI